MTMTKQCICGVHVCTRSRQPDCSACLLDVLLRLRLYYGHTRYGAARLLGEARVCRARERHPHARVEAVGVLLQRNESTGVQRYRVAPAAHAAHTLAAPVELAEDHVAQLWNIAHLEHLLVPEAGVQVEDAQLGKGATAHRGVVPAGSCGEREASERACNAERNPHRYIGAPTRRGGAQERAGLRTETKRTRGMLVVIYWETCQHIKLNANITHRRISEKLNQSALALSPLLLPRHRPPLGGHRLAARGSLYRLAARATRLPRPPRDGGAWLRRPLAQCVERLEEEGPLLRTAHGETQLLLRACVRACVSERVSERVSGR